MINLQCLERTRKISKGKDGLTPFWVIAYPFSIHGNVSNPHMNCHGSQELPFTQKQSTAEKTNKKAIRENWPIAVELGSSQSHHPHFPLPIISAISSTCKFQSLAMDCNRSTSPAAGTVLHRTQGAHVLQHPENVSLATLRPFYASCRLEICSKSCMAPQL